MEKRYYQKPTLHIVKIQQTHIICNSPEGVEGTGVHDDDPQPPGGAMTRESCSVWDEEW